MSNCHSNCHATSTYHNRWSFHIVSVAAFGWLRELHGGTFRPSSRRIQHLVPKTSWGFADRFSDQSVCVKWLYLVAKHLRKVRNIPKAAATVSYILYTSKHPKILVHLTLKFEVVFRPSEVWRTSIWSISILVTMTQSRICWLSVKSKDLPASSSYYWRF